MKQQNSVYQVDPVKFVPLDSQQKATSSNPQRFPRRSKTIGAGDHRRPPNNMFQQRPQPIGAFTPPTANVYANPDTLRYASFGYALLRTNVA
ncbi:hypothetical protein Ciccas_003010 [Cichlidogyrus casuarinus]|uniref:Uncharacterized protein n=1 Tax=Cichlidogyrus casuarinus TaxID=1844966 RepID=A0ABD2QFL4_9PLAT